MSAAHWEHFEHQADIGVRGVGPRLSDAFEQAALALTAVITDPADVATEREFHIDCEAPDNEYLFYEWLNQVIYLMATERVLFSRFDVRLADHRLEATLWGEVMDREKHQPVVEIKGATLTELSVRRQADGSWRAQTIVDV